MVVTLYTNSGDTRQLNKNLAVVATISNCQINDTCTILRPVLRFELSASYLAANYDLPDHRGDPAYGSWETSSRHFNALVHLPESANITDHLAAASDPNLLTVVLSGGAMAEPLSLPEDVLDAAKAANDSSSVNSPFEILPVRWNHEPV